MRSDRIEVGNVADAELRKVGKDALPAIDAALKGADPDLALRLRKIATTLRLPDAAEALHRIEQVLLDASTVRIDFHQECRTLGRSNDVRTGSTGSQSSRAKTRRACSSPPRREWSISWCPTERRHEPGMARPWSPPKGSPIAWPGAWPGSESPTTVPSAPGAKSISRTKRPPIRRSGRSILRGKPETTDPPSSRTRSKPGPDIRA